jgi:three-Cys-motif partner protein
MNGQISFFEDPKRPAPTPRLPQPKLTTPDGHVPDDEGLLAREIRRHSLEKAWRVGRFAEVVSIAVAGKLPVYWVEFFSGPGRLLVHGTSEFMPGSPMQALTVPRPFAGYFFADLSGECCRCLRTRTQGMHGVHIHQGDANGVGTMDALVRVVPENALVIAYLDPQGLDLHMDTIRALAWRFRKLDLIVNLPVNGLVRNIATEKAGGVLGHPNPQELLAQGKANLTRNIRTYFRDQLEALRYPRENQTSFEVRQADKKALLYDLVVAGRHPLTKELFDRASEVGPHGERRLRAVADSSSA